MRRILSTTSVRGPKTSLIGEDEMVWEKIETWVQFAMDG